MWLWATVLTMLSPLVTALPGQLASNERKFYFLPKRGRFVSKKTRKTHLNCIEKCTKQVQMCACVVDQVDLVAVDKFPETKEDNNQENGAKI
jgi:hypothetical protein